MPKKLNLNDIVKCCESRFNRGLAADWKHSDYNDLSFEILRNTNVNISPNTLKRIFGKITVDDDYLPQYATIDALKKYGGYTDALTEPIIALTEKPVASKIDNSFFKTYKQSFIISIGAIALMFCGFFAFNTFFTNNKPSATIQLVNVEGLLPATAFFNVQLPITDDSVFVDFGDKSPLLYLKSGQKNAAHNYLFPGVFNVTLRVSQTTVASAKVGVNSNKWIALGFNSQREVRNHRYEFPAVKTGSDSLFHISNGQLHKMGLDTLARTYTRLSNFVPTGYASDNFVFETSFKNNPHEKGIACQSTQFQISGINSMIRFKLVNAGCSFWVLNMVSEQVFDGSKTNLSQFVVDLQQWNTVKMINQNKHVTLFVNGKLLFDGKYEKPLGEIRGLFIEFEGNGFIKQSTLTTSDGIVLYRF